MTYISSLQNIHKHGTFGDYENKNENELLKLKEVKNLIDKENFLSNVEKHEQLLEIARTRDLQRQQMNHLNTIRTMHAEALTSVFNQNPLKR